MEISNICIEDIAHSLSLLARYGGHTRTLLSVAEHSIVVAWSVFDKTESAELAYAALMHDASEAYMQDLISPIKYRLPAYIKAEHQLQKVINKHFSIKLTKTEKALIKAHDLAARHHERAWPYGQLSAKQAERNFLRVHRYLKHAIVNNYPIEDIREVLALNITS